MARAAFSLDDEAVLEADVAVWAKAGSIAVGRQTRLANGTGAAGRSGRHAALAADEKTARRARREAAQAKRRETAETLASAVAMRRARRRAKEEEERAGCRRRLVVQVPREPKVTANGGRNLYRRHERFEQVVMPLGLGGGGSARGNMQTSLVFRIKGRSLGGKGRARWRRGEAARFARYLVRPPALATDPDRSIVTNIVTPSVGRGSDAFVRELVAFMIAAEETEQAVDPEGQVYKSILFALPHELGVDEHQRIVRTLTDPLRKRNLPFLAVIHAPDPNGDQRNVHLHLMVLIREFEPVGERTWAFGRTKVRDLFNPAMLKVWRRLTVSTFNNELRRVGSGRRYTTTPTAQPGQHRGRVATARLREHEADRKLDRARTRLGTAERYATAARAMVASIDQLAAVIDSTEQMARAIIAHRCAKARLIAMGQAAKVRLVERTTMDTRSIWLREMKRRTETLSATTLTIEPNVRRSVAAQIATLAEAGRQQSAEVAAMVDDVLIATREINVRHAVAASRNASTRLTTIIGNAHEWLVRLVAQRSIAARAGAHLSTERLHLAVTTADNAARTAIGHARRTSIELRNQVATLQISLSQAQTVIGRASAMSRARGPEPLPRGPDREILIQTVPSRPAIPIAKPAIKDPVIVPMLPIEAGRDIGRELIAQEQARRAAAVSETTPPATEQAVAEAPGWAARLAGLISYREKQRRQKSPLVATDPIEVEPEVDAIGPTAPIYSLPAAIGDVRADAIRFAVKAIDAAKTVPLRRHLGTAGMQLEIMTEKLGLSSPLLTAARLEDDPVVQAALKRRHSTLVAKIERHLAKQPASDRATLFRQMRVSDPGLAQDAVELLDDGEIAALSARVSPAVSKRPVVESGRGDADDRQSVGDLVDTTAGPDPVDALAATARLFHETSWDPRDYDRQQANTRSAGAEIEWGTDRQEEDVDQITAWIHQQRGTTSSR